jgi:outer membrane protein OmpA-like peptidoglycan-associated protein
MSNTDPLDPQRLQKVDRFVDTELGYITTSRYTVINFPTNSSEITDEIQAQIAKLLNRGPSYIIVIKSIIGYASEIGSLANNIRLSGERAQAMALQGRQRWPMAGQSLPMPATKTVRPKPRPLKLWKGMRALSVCRSKTSPLAGSRRRRARS